MTDKHHLKRNVKNLFLCIRYAFHAILLAIEIQLCKSVKKTAPVILCLANPGSIGGTELQVQIIAEALKARLGHCLVLVSGKLERGRSNLFFKHLKTLGIPILQLRSLGLVPYDQWPFLTKKSAKLLEKTIKNSQICHFFNPSSTVLAPVMKRLGLSIYYMETGMPVPNGGWKALYTTIGYFDYVSSVSGAGLHRLELSYGYKGPSCVTPSMFKLPSRQFLCRKPKAGVFDLVYFGRMTRNKGVDLLIAAFHRLLKDFPHARLFLIGSGERVSLLQNRVNELRISDRVQFIDWLQNEELFSHLIKMDLFCLPSFSEGLPCSILEAMSIGLPIVATDVGGVSEIIEHNISGILIPPKDEEALTEALLTLANAPLQRVQLRENALLRWQKVGSKEVILNRLITAYEML